MRRTTFVLLTAALGACASPEEAAETTPTSTLRLGRAAEAIDDRRWDDAEVELASLKHGETGALAARWLLAEVREEMGAKKAIDAAAAAIEAGEQRKAIDQLMVVSERGRAGVYREAWEEALAAAYGSRLRLEGRGTVSISSSSLAVQDAALPYEAAVRPGWLAVGYRADEDAPLVELQVLVGGGEALTLDLGDAEAILANAIDLEGRRYVLGGGVRAVVGGRPGARPEGAMWFPDHVEEAVKKLGSPLFGERRERNEAVMVDKIVLHSDLEPDSRGCFDALLAHGLSTHFMVDWDGAVFQTLDTSKAAFHAGEANASSIGIDLNNLMVNLVREPEGRPYDPEHPRYAEMSRPEFARPKSQRMRINGGKVQTFGYTDAQYAALARLVAALLKAYPELLPIMPRTSDGAVIQDVLGTPGAKGILGHHHVAVDRWDPGPGMDWDRLCRDLFDLGVPISGCPPA